MTTLRVTMIDNKPAVFLPEGVGITEGSEISFDGSVLRVKDDDADGQFDAMTEVMERRKDVLRQFTAIQQVMTEDRVALAKLAE
ncbi:MAG: hypothetical protein ACRCT8_06490 [Lacipirellulaceae bacterium]